MEPNLTPPSTVEALANSPKTKNAELHLINQSKLEEPDVKDSQPNTALVIDQPVREAVREATPLEPTVVAIPVSTQIPPSDWKNESSTRTKSNLAGVRVDESPAERTNTNVELVYRDVQSLQLVGVIEKVLVDDETVCKAMISESKEIMLLGVGQGKTRVKVVMASKDSSVPNIHFINATVREAWSTTSPQQVSTFAKATQSISELFPTARIAIRTNENGSLTLFGRTDSEEQAKQIASLVRKMFLVPIQDRIAVATTR